MVLEYMENQLKIEVTITLKSVLYGPVGTTLKCCNGQGISVARRMPWSRAEG